MNKEQELDALYLSIKGMLEAENAHSKMVIEELKKDQKDLENKLNNYYEEN